MLVTMPMAVRITYYDCIAIT